MDEDKVPNTEWKIHLFWLVIVALILLLSRHDHGPLQKQFDEVKEWAYMAEKDAEKLRKAMDRFDSENWQDVVPDVRHAAKELHVTTDVLSVEVFKLEEALTPANNGE